MYCYILLVSTAINRKTCFTTRRYYPDSGPNSHDIFCGRLMTVTVTGYKVYYIDVGNIKGAIKNGQSREIGNIRYTRRRKTQHIMCWTPLYVSKLK